MRGALKNDRVEQVKMLEIQNDTLVRQILLKALNFSMKLLHSNRLRAIKIATIENGRTSRL